MPKKIDKGIGATHQGFTFLIKPISEFCIPSLSFEAHTKTQTFNLKPQEYFLLTTLLSHQKI